MGDKLNLKQKLVEIRKSIGILQKTEKGNKGATYVDPAVVLLKIREGMDKHGVLLVPEIVSSKNIQIPAPTANNAGNIDFLCEMNMVCTWYDADSDDTLKCAWLAVGSHMQDPSMAFGGGLTYSERYFLLKFFQIPTTKDDPEFLKEKTGVIEFITEDQIANIDALIDETKSDIIAFKQHIGVSEISGIWAKNYNHVIGILETKRENSC